MSGEVNEEEIDAFVDKLTDEGIQYLLSALSSSRVIIPNWYLKEHVEELLQKKVSDEEFAKIRDAVNESAIPEELSVDILNLYALLIQE